MTSYLSTIDNPQKAYCLGFFANIENSQSSFAKYCYELNNIHPEDDKIILDIFKNIVDIIYDVADDNEDEGDNQNSSVSMTLIEDNQTIADINNGIKGFSKFTIEEKKGFVRGWYEYSHLMNENGGTGDLILIRPKILDDFIITEIFDYINIPYCRETDKIIFKYGCSSVDFLGFLYSNIDNQYTIKYANYNYLIPTCNFIRVDENAIVPSKTNWSDVGYDLSIIKKVKDLNSKTALYDTGIKIQLDFGYYAEIVPRSSISKSGYILSNNIGIIDNSYRGNLLIALTKIADDAIEIEYPFKCCQLIFKSQIYVNMFEIKDRDMDKTKRQDGGFGSTGA